MSNKKELYRVYAMHELAKHTGSDFEKFANLENAIEWAVAFGRKKGAEQVILYKKDSIGYNHYTEVRRINLN